MATQLECFTCGGSYTADQRRRHEATTKHKNAVIGHAMTGQAFAKAEAKAKKEREVRSPMVPRPETTPEMIAKVEANIAELNSAPQTSEEPTSIAPAAKARATSAKPAPTGIEALERKVKARAADVRWTEKHDPDKADLLALRRERLAAAEAALAAAKA